MTPHVHGYHVMSLPRVKAFDGLPSPFQCMCTVSLRPTGALTHFSQTPTCLLVRKMAPAGTPPPPPPPPATESLLYGLH